MEPRCTIDHLYSIVERCRRCDTIGVGIGSGGSSSDTKRLRTVSITLVYPFILPLRKGTTPDLSRIWESYHRVCLLLSRVEGSVV